MSFNATVNILHLMYYIFVCILHICMYLYFLFRKDDPIKLKSLIVNIQNASVEKKQMGEQDSRVKFMLEVCTVQIECQKYILLVIECISYMIRKTKCLVLQILLAIKNNNVKKIPNYDPEHQLHLQ